MQPEKMIRMPVPTISGNILRHFIFPFHKLPAQTDFRSGEFAHSCCYLYDFRVFVPSQFFAGFDHHVEHFTNHSLRSWTAQWELAMFGRVRRVCYQCTVAFVCPKIVYPEKSSIEHCIIILFQEVFIKVELIILPNILTHPYCPCRKMMRRAFLGRCRIAPDIILMMRHPAANIAAIGFAIILLRCILSTRNQTSDILYHRQMTRTQIGRLCRPIIHLYIDIRMVIGIPWIGKSFTPYSLQVGGQRTSWRRYQKITAELEIQHFKILVFLFRVGILLHAFQQTVRRGNGCLRQVTEIQSHSVV